MSQSSTGTAVPPGQDEPNPFLVNEQYLERLKQEISGRSLKQTVEVLIKDLVTAGISVLAGFLASAIARRLLEVHDETSHTLAGTSLVALIHPQIRRVVESVVGSLVPFATSEVRRCTALFEAIVRTTTEQSSNCSPFIRQSVKRLDDSIRSSLVSLAADRTPSSYPTTTNEVEEAIALRQCFWLSQARRIANYLETLDLARLSDFINTLAPVLRLPFRVIVAGVVAASVRGVRNTWRVQILLLGPHGRGKDRIVRALAEMLQALLIDFPSETLTPTDLTGETDEYKVGKFPGAASELKVKGRLRDAIREHGVRNPILFLNEFSFKGFGGMFGWRAPAMKKFLDTPKGGPKDNELEDLEHTNVILASNDDEKDFPAAFLDRFDVYDVPELDEDSAKRIISQRSSEVRRQFGVHTETSEELHKPSTLKSPWKTPDDVVNETLVSAAVTETNLVLQGFSIEIAKHHAMGGRFTCRAVNRTFDFIWFEKVLHGDASYDVPREEILEVIAINTLRRPGATD